MQARILDTTRLPTAVHEIRAQARSAPERLALVIPTTFADGVILNETRTTYGELWERVSAFARGLEADGLREGDRVLVAAPLSTDVYAFLLAVFARGLTAVFIDATTRSKKAVKQAIESARPRAIVATPQLLRYRFALPRLWRARAYVVGGSTLGASPLDKLAKAGPPLDPLEVSPDHEAMITYTSGSTDRPKGVVRTYAVSLAQHEALSDVDDLRGGDVHLTSLPVFAFHNLIGGATTVLPARDPMRRDGTDVKAVVTQLLNENVTHLTGAPAFVEEIADELLRTNTVIPSLRHVQTGAAPVGRTLAEKLIQAYAGADVRVIYGSTEAEPMTFTSARDLVAQHGHGYLVGRPTPHQELRVVSLPDTPIAPKTICVRDYICPVGSEGEIVVCGPHVVERYLDDPTSEARLKIRDIDGRLWHRTLDLGFFDEQGCLRLTGRVPDRIKLQDRTFAPLPLEAALNDVPGVLRSALIAHARAPSGEVLVQCREPMREGLLSECKSILNSFDLSHLPLLIVKDLPVDPRHFSKLDRPTLRAERGAP